MKVTLRLLGRLKYFQLNYQYHSPVRLGLR